MLQRLYISFEESPDALIHNLQSINLQFGEHTQSGQLTLNSRRTVEMGLEEHIISIVDAAKEQGSEMVVLDPISALLDIGTLMEVKMLLIRFISYMKNKGITLLFTELVPDSSGEYSSLTLSSMTDTWIRLRRIEQNGEYTRLINVIKSRGIKTSNQVKEFFITDEGISIEEPYIGDGQMLFGSAKRAQSLIDEETERQRQHEISLIEDKLLVLEEENTAQLKLSYLHMEIKKELLNQQKNELLNDNKMGKTRRIFNKRLRE